MATLTGNTESGLSELEDGTRVSAETARRLSCDAGRVVVRHEAGGSVGDSMNGSVDGAVNGSKGSVTGSNGAVRGSVRSSVRGSVPGSVRNSAGSSLRGALNGSVRGSVLDVGRKTRTIPPALRRALDVRDRGCRFPGCGLRFTDAHHIVHWADGGDTKLDNTLLLCRRHHRSVHEGGYRVCSDRNGTVVFFTPRGKAIFEAPPPPRLCPDPLETLVLGNRERGVRPDWSSGAQRWKRDRDVPWQIEAAARKALDPGDEPEP
jgi:hypothetical protein